MTERPNPSVLAAPPRGAFGDEVSLISLGTELLRRRRLIAALAIGGALLGLGVALIQPAKYVSSATFIPQATESANSELSVAASQFGIRLPAGGGDGWGPAVYVELLTSRALLEPLARDTLTVAELGGRRISVIELFDVDDENLARRVDKTVEKLARQVVSAGEVKSLQAVKLRVVTPWPSASHQIAKKLVAGVNTFNVESRRSKAIAEREFVAEQAARAETTLAAAESRFRTFLQRNRVISSQSEAQFEHDRLQREVSMLQQIHSSWLKSREDARIREVRDTPVLTIIEEPRAAVRPQSRRIGLKAVTGMLAGALVGTLIAFVALLFARARNEPAGDTEEFLRLVDQVRPNFLRKRSAR